ncbi:MAG: YbaB/EbfC family nucleoid-associated protein, partial [Acidimicrobiales bacterium]
SDPTAPKRPEPGGLPGLGDLGGLLESAQEAFSAQARAAEEVVTGNAGGGVVTVEMTGTGEVRSITLAPEVVDPEDIEMLQDLILAALHDAGHKVTVLQRDALGALGGLDLDGLGGALGGLLGGPGGGPGPDRG